MPCSAVRVAPKFALLAHTPRMVWRGGVRVASYFALSASAPLKGCAVDTSSMKISENRKAMINCGMVPGRTKTMKPTKKSFFHASRSSHQK